MDPRIVAALAAGTGGISPNLLHVAQSMVKQVPDALPGPLFLGGMLIFFIMGGAVALFFGENIPKKAFVLGIGLPALITTLQAQHGPKVGLVDLIPSAYAQQAVQPASPQAQSPGPAASAPVVKPQLALTADSIRSCNGCEVWFADASGKVLSKNFIAPQSSGTKVWTIPQNAQKFAIIDPRSNARFVTLPQVSEGLLTVDFDRKYSAWNDFRRGLGAFDLKAYEQVVEIKKSQ
jgi:hypothetical protein